MNGTRDLAEEIAHLHRIGVNVLFNFSSGQDAKDSNAMIGQADQGGLGLPEKDYYFRDDAKALETAEGICGALVRMLRTAGRRRRKAAKRPKPSCKLETAMAQSLARRDLAARSREDLPQDDAGEIRGAFGFLQWSRYFAAMQAPPMDSLNVAVPDFFKGQEELLKEEPIEVWKTYLTLHLVAAVSGDAAGDVRRRNFAFYGKYLTGAKKEGRAGSAASRNRWRSGRSLGKAYVEQTFGAEGKQRTLDMVHSSKPRCEQDLRQLTWMTPATKKKALEKLHAITNKIGYPDKWRDYSR